MDAVGKEQALGVYCKLVKLLCGAVTLVVVEYVLYHMADRDVVLAVLVPVDVASPLGSLGQVVCILFLLQGQFFPTGNLIAHDLEVCKLVKQILEITLFLSAAGCYGQHTSHHHNSK